MPPSLHDHQLLLELIMPLVATNSALPFWQSTRGAVLDSSSSDATSTWPPRAARCKRRIQRLWHLPRYKEFTVHAIMRNMQCCKHQAKPQGPGGSPPRPFALGIGKVLSRPCALPRAIGGTSSAPSLLHATFELRESSTQESPLASKLVTLKDRLLSYRKLTQGTESFQTSGLESTSKGQGCSPYWNSRSPDDSRRLWCPTEIGLHDLGSSLSNTSSFVTEPWLKYFSIKAVNPEALPSSQTTSWQSLRFSQPVTTDEDEAALPSTRCRKLRVYPSPNQLRLFNSFMGASRFFYNRANEVVIHKMAEAKRERVVFLDALVFDGLGCCNGHVDAPAKDAEEVDAENDHPAKRPKKRCGKPIADGSRWFCEAHKDGPLGVSYKGFLSLPKLRPLVMKSDKDIAEKGPDAWQKEVPYDLRQGAIKELVTAYKSAFALKANGHIKGFSVCFKSKKSPRQVFYCRANAFNAAKQTIFKTRLAKRGSKLRMRKRDLLKLLREDSPHGDFVVQKNGAAWYICLPLTPKEDRLPVYENAAYKSVFIDPGVRTFQTFYSPDGVCGKIGDRFCEEELDHLAGKVDGLCSLMNKPSPMGRGRWFGWKTRRNMKSRAASFRQKIGHKVDDLHWKTCRFLCLAFQNIFIPKFGVKDMVKCRDGRRVIRNNTVRRMLELSHGRFIERLKYCAMNKHRKVYLVPESYTTKTCGSCGMQNNEVGSAKVFHCTDPECGYSLDRDLHGARNICISTIARMRHLGARAEVGG